MVDVVVVGAGPAGLSCAIEAKKAGLSVVVLEKGSLVDAIRRFPTNLVWFSTPELLEIGEVPFVIPTLRPGRIDVINYYQRVSMVFSLDIRTFDPVESIRKSDPGFVVETQSGKSHSGRNVVVATGYFDYPNRLGIAGEDRDDVFHYYDEPYRHFGSRVVVVGGRNSAVEAALDLFRHGVQVTLVHRGEELSEGVKYWILPDFLNRVKGKEIQAFFSSSVVEIKKGCIVLQTPSGIVEQENDATYVLIGFRPDVHHLRRFGIGIDPESLAPVHEESTFETNIPGLYVAGSVVAGKNNNKIFVENGRLHGKSIVKSILARKMG